MIPVVLSTFWGGAGGEWTALSALVGELDRASYGVLQARLISFS